MSKIIPGNKKCFEENKMKKWDSEWSEMGGAISEGWSGNTALKK